MNQNASILRGFYTVLLYTNKIGATFVAFSQVFTHCSKTKNSGKVEPFETDAPESTDFYEYKKIHAFMCFIICCLDFNRKNSNSI